MEIATDSKTSAILGADERCSGILLHVTSLPGRFGIGDFGPAAFHWIDLLSDAGQAYWQILPIAPTGCGDSPYGPLCSFAANPLLASPERMLFDNLVTVTDIDASEFHFPDDSVDYGQVQRYKNRLIRIAWRNFSRAGSAHQLYEPHRKFCEAQSHWLQDYALFIALKQHFKGQDYLNWPAAYLQRDPAVLQQASRELREEIDRVCFEQFLLFRQWRELKAYADQKQVRLIGDLPIFVARDSSDVWASPQIFLLDEHQRPQVVAGVPPDYFSETGQLWGNPIYDWDAVKQNGYRWWIARLQATLDQVDIVRLDHFRAFAAAWHIPADATTAIDGEWVPGPGSDFFESVRDALGGLPFIAEDLGHITDDVRELRDEFHLPGMRVLQFGFDGDPNNSFLPQHYTHNSIAYTGTHDNDTTLGWYHSLNPQQQATIWRTLDLPRPDDSAVVEVLLNVLWESEAGLVIVPLQDLLGLGTEARMNVPGLADGNWGWRCTESMLRPEVFHSLKQMTASSNRRKAH
jgi:4-alpha-glucanotransferase